MEFSKPEYWSGEPFPSPGDLPNPGIEPGSPALQVASLPAGEENGNPLQYSCLENSPWMGYSPWGHKELDTTE